MLPASASRWFCASSRSRSRSLRAVRTGSFAADTAASRWAWLAAMSRAPASRVSVAMRLPVVISAFAVASIGSASVRASKPMLARTLASQSVTIFHAAASARPTPATISNSVAITAVLRDVHKSEIPPTIPIHPASIHALNCAHATLTPAIAISNAKPQLPATIASKMPPMVVEAI